MSDERAMWHGIPRQEDARAARAAAETQVPTIKGALQKAPSFLSFEVTSTEQEDIQPFLGEVRALIGDNGLVLANETRL